MKNLIKYPFVDAARDELRKKRWAEKCGKDYIINNDRIVRFDKQKELFNKWCIDNNIRKKVENHSGYWFKLFANWARYIPRYNGSRLYRKEMFSSHSSPFYFDHGVLFDTNELIEEKHKHIYGFQKYQRVFVYHPYCVFNNISDEDQNLIDFKNICEESGLSYRIFSNEYSWYYFGSTSMVELRIKDIEKFIYFIQDRKSRDEAKRLEKEADKLWREEWKASFKRKE